MLAGKRVLLIIGGGIAAYKGLELIREFRRRGATVVPVLTKAAEEFITPLSAAALAGEKVHTQLFDLTSEAEMGHIQLSRSADLLVVAPCTANLMAKMAGGHADDLASTLLLATDKRVLIAPAMNVRMWLHPATARNLAQLQADGVLTVGPAVGDMACGEHGPGRMADPEVIADAVGAALAEGGAAALSGVAMHRPFAPGPGAGTLPPGSLAGQRIIVTSGPTHEPIDPVRYIANRSSGAQGTALARSLAALGAEVVFVTGPAQVPPPEGVEVVRIETAREMLAAVERALPADAAVFAAAVADWRVANASGSKMKKDGNGKAPALEFIENPDILATVSKLAVGRPRLVVGFAAETDQVIAHATAKLARKGCDWIVANDVSPATGIMGGSENAVTIIRPDGAESWPRMEKDAVARRLAGRIAAELLDLPREDAGADTGRGADPLDGVVPGAQAAPADPEDGEGSDPRRRGGAAGRDAAPGGSSSGAQIRPDKPQGPGRG